MKKQVLILTDNEFIYDALMLISNQIEEIANFSFRYSFFNNAFKEKYLDNHDFIPVNVSKEQKDLIEKYNLIISWHCKQIFPKELVKNIKCINIHPGYNPYNRGWFPQVFSIINKKPCGATIHEIDEMLDHGPIICQKIVKIEDDDTSYTAYMKILHEEILLFKNNMHSLIEGDYKTFFPYEAGNINYKNDYNKLLELDLEKSGTFGEFIDILRALTHDKYENTFYR